jgi:cytochrome c-type biogenesis protein CcmH
MSEVTESTGFPKIALFAALAVFVAAIGYGAWQSSGDDAATDAVANMPADKAGNPGLALAALEERTRKDPTDVESWQLLGWSYFENGRYKDAADAYARAARLAPDRAVYWSSLGEALIMANEQDPMPKDAADAFDKAIALDAKDPRARYFVAVRKDLAGDHQGAVNDWLALLKDTPKGAPWESDLMRTIEQVGKINNIDVATRLKSAADGRLPSVALPADVAAVAPNSVAAAPIPGPSRADMAAAAKLPAGQQQEMVMSMVEGLEAKLAKNPANVDGWIMLMRSRMTLGETGKAQAAFKKAVAANPATRQRLTSEAQILGVPTG